VWQDKFLKLRFAQLRRNRLPAWVSRHSLSPNIWTLTDLPSPIANPLPARLTDKFDRPEKLATSSKVETLELANYFLKRVDITDVQKGFRYAFVVLAKTQLT